MKLASEWGMQIAEKLIPDSMNPDVDKRLPYIIAEEIVKQIQLDAFKAGMQNAAELIGSSAPMTRLNTCHLLFSKIDSIITLPNS